MRKTEHFQMNLPETADQLSLGPLNENTEKMDKVLCGMAEQMRGQVKMARGSYAGNGDASVTIQTPGFQPEVVVMRQKRTLGISPEGVVYTDQFSVDGGWTFWAGEKTLDTNVYVPDAGYELVGTQQIIFTAMQGSLSWTTEHGELAGINQNINNKKGVIYEWIAFGYGVVS